MDTRFWGPSGWALIHLVVQDPVKGKRKEALQEWLTLLEYALPCKYCRASFHDYIRLQPLTSEILDSPITASRWVYDIHNRVNDKLRGQGLLTTPNPEWSEIRERYETLHRSLCGSSPLLGWDFMTSIAYATPDANYVAVPMPDIPESPIDVAAFDDAAKNRYNTLTRKERLPYLKRWWQLIPSILPCAAWRRAWAAAMRTAGAPPLAAGRDAMMQWMWAIEEGVCGSLRCPTPHRSLPAMKKEVSAFESGCGRARSGKTCRTLRKTQRRRVRTQRTRRGTLVL
jgi:hypothetical protein